MRRVIRLFPRLLFVASVACGKNGKSASAGRHGATGPDRSGAHSARPHHFEQHPPDAAALGFGQRRTPPSPSSTTMATVRSWAFGDTARLAAQAKDAADNLVPRHVINWSVADGTTSVVTVDQSGLVPAATAVSPGSIAIKATIQSARARGNSVRSAPATSWQSADTNGCHRRRGRRACDRQSGWIYDHHGDRRDGLRHGAADRDRPV